jgi:two-component system CheB/CheR fusion protein
MSKEHPAPLRILIVDDCIDMATSLALLVRGWGHKTQVANDGPTALHLAGEQPFDVVFLDIGMPRMTGWELAERLRQMPNTARAYLVVVSGHGQALNKVCSQTAGCDLHLLKPVAPEVVHELLSSRQRERQVHAS